MAIKTPPGVDIDRYALADPIARSAIVGTARAALAREGCAMLPDFLTGEALRRMVSEVEIRMDQAWRRDITLAPYGDCSDEGYPADHPRRRVSPYKMFVVATDLLPPDGAMRSLYDSQELTELIADIVGISPLYRVADPLLSCVATVLDAGDEHGWHFDDNDFVVSLLLQPAGEGGEFEFAPGVRSAGDENYAVVARIMDGETGMTNVRSVKAGTLMLFRGKNSLHRVRRVNSGKPRIIALFSYDTNAGMQYSRETRQHAVGRATPINA
jgi:hypothetical protein